MIIIFTFCFVSLFNSINLILYFKKEYDLINGYNKEIQYFYAGVNAYLYIPASKNKKFQISLILNNISKKPFHYLYIYMRKRTNLIMNMQKALFIL